LFIRAATVADIPTLQALAETIWRRYYPRIISSAQIEFMLARMYSTAQIESELRAGHCWELTELDGAPVGFIATHLADDVTLKLDKLYLQLAWHGKGYGQQMLRHVETRARALGSARIQLFVNRNNTSAVRAYLRAGFQIVEELDQLFGEFVLNDYRMTKDCGRATTA
jgi:ribosomal protein S18 acetylase RimI-like enzyme